MGGVVTIRSGTDAALQSASDTLGTHQQLTIQREQHEMDQAEQQAQFQARERRQEQEQAYTYGLTQAMIDNGPPGGIPEISLGKTLDKLLNIPGALAKHRDSQLATWEKDRRQVIANTAIGMHPDDAAAYLQVAENDLFAEKNQQQTTEAVQRARRAQSRGLFAVSEGDGSAMEESFDAEMQEAFEGILASTQAGVTSPEQLSGFIRQAMDDASKFRAEWKQREMKAANLQSAIDNQDNNSIQGALLQIQDRILSDEDYTLTQFDETLRNLQDAQDPARRGRITGQPDHQSLWKDAVKNANLEEYFGSETQTPRQQRMAASEEYYQHSLKMLGLGKRESNYEKAIRLYGEGNIEDFRGVIDLLSPEERGNVMKAVGGTGNGITDGAPADDGADGLPVTSGPSVPEVAAEVGEAANKGAKGVVGALITATTKDDPVGYLRDEAAGLAEEIKDSVESTDIATAFRVFMAEDSSIFAFYDDLGIVDWVQDAVTGADAELGGLIGQAADAQRKKNVETGAKGLPTSKQHKAAQSALEGMIMAGGDKNQATKAIREWIGEFPRKKLDSKVAEKALMEYPQYFTAKERRRLESMLKGPLKNAKAPFSAAGRFDLSNKNAPLRSQEGGPN